MNCSMGESLAEYGFKFFEKLHAPIFLVSKLGKVIRMNEAGRKLLQIAHFSVSECEKSLASRLANFADKDTERIWLRSGKMELQLIASDLKNSDYFLVEVKRS